MTEGIVIIASAAFTAVVLNFVITVFRRHEQHHEVSIGVQDILDDATDVSLSVKNFTRQLGGHA